MTSIYYHKMDQFLGYGMGQLIVPTLLFVLLQPGLIMTVPPSSQDKRWFTCETTYEAMIIHGLIYAVLLYFIRYFLPNLF